MAQLQLDNARLVCLSAYACPCALPQAVSLQQVRRKIWQHGNISCTCETVNADSWLDNCAMQYGCYNYPVASKIEVCTSPTETPVLSILNFLVSQRNCNH